MTQPTETTTPETALVFLRASAPSPATDDFIDELTERLLHGPATADWSPALLVAHERARAPLTRRSTALCLAVTAAMDDRRAVDSLVGSYRDASGDSFLGPAILESLGILALRNHLARAEATLLLVRLQPTEASYPLVSAARVIGSLLDGEPNEALLVTLTQWSCADDLEVAAEARYQLALRCLADSFLAGTRAGLQEGLIAARAAFARAASSEEVRPDAQMFVRLLDILLAFSDVASSTAERSSQITQTVHSLQSLASSREERTWHGYRSEAEDLLAANACAVADAFSRAVQREATADVWLDFEAAILELAALYGAIRSTSATVAGLRGPCSAMGRSADALYAPWVGLLLSRAAGRKRIELVLQRYIIAHGDDETSEALRALLRSLEASDCRQDLSPQVVARLIAVADQSGCPAESLYDGFCNAAADGAIDVWVRGSGLSVSPLPIDNPELFGGDPAVDEAVRGILSQLRERLPNYPRKWWHRLVDVVVRFVQFIHLVRDTLPPYTLCKEDGGLGQSASESDLQEDLFTSLRKDFGAAVFYEQQRVGGGKPDTGLQFADCEFPFEVKHEFQNVTRDHIRVSYLRQVSDYASARQRVSFLVILDMRGSNAAAHQKRLRQAKKAGERASLISLYGLQEGIWVDHLPIDPQVEGAQTQLVVVGLVPGNRVKPSSTTRYSDRPKRERNAQSHPDSP